MGEEESSQDLRTEWNNLFEEVKQQYSSPCANNSTDSAVNNVSSASSSSNLSPESLPPPAFLRGALVRRGLRPKSKVLNFLLDALSLQFAELERNQWKPEVEAEQTPTDAVTRCTADEETSERFMSNVVAPNSPSINNGNTSYQNQTTCENDETTDDEDSFFKSPSLMSYKMKSLDRSRNTDKSKTKMKTSAAAEGSLGHLEDITEHVEVDFKTIGVTKNVLVTPEKAIGKREAGERDVRRQLKLDESSPPMTATQGATPPNHKDETHLLDLDDSTITLDATPPPPPKISKQSLSKPKRNISLSKGFSEPTMSQDRNENGQFEESKIVPFSITIKKKKEAWVDPDHTRRTFKPKIKHKQMNLVSMVNNLPKKKIDVTKLKEHTGGSWFNSTQVSEEKSGTKRKSDEYVQNLEKRDKMNTSSLSQTFFEISPIKVEVRSPEQEEFYATPVSNSSKLSNKSNATAHCSKIKPLSPSKTNIINDPDASKPGTSSKSKNHNTDKFESTFDIIKDFDKIPRRGPASPTFKYKEPTVRKKDERAKLPAWDCDECRQYYAGLESQMDERELARIKDRCSTHRSKVAPNLNCTPEGFWDTKAPSTEELYAGGFIRVASVAFTPLPRIRKKADSDDDFFSEN